MYPRPVQKLIDLFVKFPGIGPRQASRFVFYILKNQEIAQELREALEELAGKVKFCSQCFRSVETETLGQVLCSLCLNPKRDPALIAVVEKESDMQNLEKTGAYSGLYHILGGLISPLDENSAKALHLREFFERVKKILQMKSRCEVILATSATSEGDLTAMYIERILTPLKNQYPGLILSRLGRGLSLGSELEYADEITLKNALLNRK